MVKIIESKELCINQLYRDLIKRRVAMSRVIDRGIENWKSQTYQLIIVVGQLLTDTLPSKKQTDDTATRSDKNASKSESISSITLDTPLRVSLSVSVGTVINKAFAILRTQEMIMRELDKEEEAKKENRIRGLWTSLEKRI